MKIKRGTNNNSPRGLSLVNDLKRLIDDERFYDIALKCSDGETIYGCKAILATRSDVFNSSIYGELAENDGLSFNNINSTAMEVVLEFLYTSKVENVTIDNVIEVYFASIHFKLTNLQEHIIEFAIKNYLVNEDEDVGKKLLSEYVKKFSLEVDNNNKMSDVLVYWVAKNKLKKSKNDSLSLEGLKYLLEKTFDTQISFATPEFDIWEYSLAKVIRKVTQKETASVEKILNNNTRESEEVKNLLIPLIRYIDLNRMDVNEIKQHVEPFNIYSPKEIGDVYCSKALNNELKFIRGVPIFKWKVNKLDTSDNQIIVSNCGFVVETINELKQPKSILGDLIIKGNKSDGIYEWDILIEKLCGIIYIGICDINEDLNKTEQKYGWVLGSDIKFEHKCGWVLGSDGYVYHGKKWKWYDAKFKEGDKATVHLDMKIKTCAFSINGRKKPIVSDWKNIPSQIYPIASLGNGSKLRIEPRSWFIN